MFKKYFPILINLLILLMIIGGRTLIQTNTIFGHEIIKQDEIDRYIDGKEFNSEINVYFDKLLVPYFDNGNTTIISQKLDNHYQGKLSSQGNHIKIIEPQKEKIELMKNNQPIHVLIYNEREYKILKLKMTNLAVINLEPQTYQYDIYHDGTEYEIVTGVLRMFNANSHNDAGFELYEENCRYHIRGAGSRIFPKQSFKLNILNNSNEAKDISFLGMRDDNDWILNSMYIDESKLREKVGYTLWNDMNTSTKYQSEYVELVIDGNYLGLYLLQEPVDLLTFNSKDDEDLLFSTKIWQYQIGDSILFTDQVFETKMERIDEFQIERIDKVDYTEAIEVLRMLKSDLVSDETTLSYDLMSYANHELLLNMVGAADNHYKNQILLAREKDGSYIVEKTAWDLDLSIVEDVYEDRITAIDEFVVDEFTPISILNDENYQNLKEELYKEYRDDFYIKENIDRIISTNAYKIESAAAIVRDEECWKYEKDYEEEKSKVQNYFELRIPILDDYFNYSD